MVNYDEILLKTINEDNIDIIIELMLNYLAQLQAS
jgi:hypothetical protein